jgi:hypothetical protein
VLDKTGFCTLGSIIVSFHRLNNNGMDKTSANESLPNAALVKEDSVNEQATNDLFAHPDKLSP